ncbi:MAG: hypothetical protein AB1846_10620 [Chloroflexota bacterium]
MKKFFKWVGIVGGSVLGLLVAGVLLLYGLGQMRLNKKYVIEVEPVSVPADAASLSEGRRIFRYRGCEACHGEQLQGLVYLDNPAIGQVITPNLTTGEGGIGSQRTDRTWSAPSGTASARTGRRCCSCPRPSSTT